MHFPGSTTTLRLYHKGHEFKTHDRARLNQAFFKYFREKFIPKSVFKDTEAKIHDFYLYLNQYVDKKLKALQRLADTLAAIRGDNTIAAFHRKLVEKGKPAKVALVASMRKLLTILNAMLKNNTPWDAAKA